MFKFQSPSQSKPPDLRHPCHLWFRWAVHYCHKPKRHIPWRLMQSRGRWRARPWQQQSIDWAVGPWAAGEARKPHSIVGVVAPCLSHFLWQLSPLFWIILWIIPWIIAFHFDYSNYWSGIFWLLLFHYMDCLPLIISKQHSHVVCQLVGTGMVPWCLIRAQDTKLSHFFVQDVDYYDYCYHCQDYSDYCFDYSDYCFWIVGLLQLLLLDCSDYSHYCDYCGYCEPIQNLRRFIPEKKLFLTLRCFVRDLETAGRQQCSLSISTTIAAPSKTIECLRTSRELIFLQWQ